MSSANSMEPLAFFVSYAHDSLGDDDRHVRQFFRDLRGEVSLHSAVVDGRVGFLDSDSLRIGHRWSPELVWALTHCQVFIALCSPLYFSRPSCGKEWTVFERRLAAHTSRTRRLAPSLIPLFWVPMRDNDLPDVARRYQYRDDGFGPAYLEHGVRDLVRMTTRHQDAYQDFVTRLARRVVELTKQHQLSAAEYRPEFDSIPPAFPDPPTDPPTDRAPGPTAPGPQGPNQPSHGGIGMPTSPLQGPGPGAGAGSRPILNPNTPTRHPPGIRGKRHNDNDAQEPGQR